MSDLQANRNIRTVEWFRAALYGILLFFIYRATFAHLYKKWQEEDFSYCVIIPFIVLFLIWEKREQLAALPSIPSWKGLLPIGVGICLFFVGELAAEYTTLFISLWLVYVGLCWLHLGWRKLKVIAFPLVFSLASFVPPVILYGPASFKLKLISSRIGVAMMQMYGLSAYREGNVIDLGFTQLQVVDACSGLRFVIPLFLMGVLLAYYYRSPFWKKLVLVASTIPLSIFTNSLRIASVGILFQFWGAKVAEGFFHDFSGWFIFVVSLAFLIIEMWILNRLFKGRAHESSDRNQEKGESQQPRELVEMRAGLFRPIQATVALCLLLVTLAVAQGVNFREKTPPVRSFAEFPLQIGEWSGKRTVMEQQFLDTLQLTDYALVDYRNREGKEVSLYVAFNGSQTKGKATHSPGTCLPGSGWDFRESGPAGLQSAGQEGASMAVNRAFIEKGGARQLVYYWFPQRGRILTTLYQVKLYNFLDALTRKRTDGALVRIITPVYPSEQPAETEARLQGFARQVMPVLDTFLPK